MSRLSGSETRGLMEAYSNVYAPQELTEEQVWQEVENWVNSLLEEGYDLSEYTWEEMYKSYLEEGPFSEFNKRKEAEARTSSSPSAEAQLRQRSKNIDARGGWGGQAYRAINRAFGAKEPSWDKADRDDRRREQTALNRAKNPNWKPTLATDPKPEIDRNRNIAATTPATPRVSPTKPAAAAQTGDKAKDMATFAKANPTLAAAAAEKARIRGTSQSDNPLMKDMPGKRSMTPSVQSPTLAKDLGKGSGNQSLLNNPNASKAATPPPAAKVTPAATPSVGRKASGLSLGSSQFKPATTSQATAAAPSTSSAASGSVVPASNKIAATKQQPAVAPSGSASGGAPVRKEPLWNSYQYEDAFDIVVEYLIDNGHAETIEEAIYIMANMSEEWRESIVEAGRMHSASDQQASWHSQNTSNNSKQKSDKEIENEKGGKEFLERIKKTKKNPKYKA